MSREARGCNDIRHRNEGTTVVKSRGSDDVEPLYRHVDAEHEARKCRFYRHVDAGTGGTEVWVLQAIREPRDR